MELRGQEAGNSELSEEEEEQRKMGRKPWRGWMH